MPDITMCISKDCPKRKVCYRAIAKPDKYQSWGAFAFTKRGKCEWFMKEKKNGHSSLL